MCAMPEGLVFQLPPDLAKVAITHGLRKLVIFKHASHMYIFNRYQSVVFDQIARELMRRVFADMCNASMNFREVLDCLLAVLASFCARSEERRVGKECRS